MTLRKVFAIEDLWQRIADEFYKRLRSIEINKTGRLNQL